MQVLRAEELVDRPAEWSVAESEELARGRIATFVQDRIRTAQGDVVTREYLRHPGAVAVIAVDEDQRVVLVRQYRHPVRHRVIEPPAGLLDVSGENHLGAAQRELAEEVHLAARDWRVLTDIFSSPGILAESIRVYLARDLHHVGPPDGFAREGEEADMDTVLAPLADVVQAVLDGRLHSPSLVSGSLAAWAALHGDGFDALRPADAPWPAREIAKSR